jgi:hypothetical protein
MGMTAATIPDSAEIADEERAESNRVSCQFSANAAARRSHIVKLGHH